MEVKATLAPGKNNTRSSLKKRIWVQDVSAYGFQTADIRRYVGDSKPEPNPQIGPKDFFETASKQLLKQNGDQLICVRYRYDKLRTGFQVFHFRWIKKFR
jgi:hypothetical protein